MATNKKRLALVLTDPQYELLSRLARLQNRSRASIVVELLEQVIPVLERVVVVGEAAQRAQVQAREGLRESVERAEAQILPHVEKALGQVDLFLADVTRQINGEEGREGAPGQAPAATVGRVPPKRRGGPRPVTRGPGMGARPRKRPRGAKR